MWISLTESSPSAGPLVLIAKFENWSLGSTFAPEYAPLLPIVPVLAATVPVFGLTPVFEIYYYSWLPDKNDLLVIFRYGCLEFWLSGIEPL